ncbi:MAG: ATP synthase F1 subunit gamma [Proteiniphilum sp.]|jgi:F-type H+-transporting ATPase subunit gamma|nr:ATP synthase F1 subunit gamma [Proteiniphilum sp.]NCD14260.1 ATP synthase F1 subunit gamma [Bacteroidia bacterium]MDD2726633.1 ATP synthase F1 subunit gamma [Proteiniphilum sp.]MDD3331565.1 ATP synthase F1 subunit gamma [Proteiniphilum sp.]MDD3555276.1 ATP synthase F1 subunit gamma [Proteiniphilum sp.]
MALLKEIKSRLQSVHSTRKITTAMMMVSSAKLLKTQQLIETLYPYEQKLSHLMLQLLQGEELFRSPYTQRREVKRVAIVVFSSNTGLAGRFNHNIINRLSSVRESYMHLGEENVLIYPIGNKVAKAAQKMGMTPAGDYEAIATKPSYQATQMIAQELMRLFINGKVDRVELIYHHFISKGSQEVRQEIFLPVELPVGGSEIPDQEYIVEPDRIILLEKLLPKVIQMKLYTTHIDSVTSEHAARMTAMQIANDNADDLIDELKLEYNKVRQQSITNELLDIAGGTVR